MTAMNKRTYSLDELAKHVNGEVQGDGNITISAVGTLSGAASHQISFLTNPKYKPQLKDTKAGAVILHESLKGESPSRKRMRISRMLLTFDISFFGFLGKKMDHHFQSADKTINTKIDRFSRDSFS